MTFEQAGDLLDEIAERFPPAFFQDLNGGIALLPERKEDPEAAPGELYIMGEYCYDMMGRYICLYYGSLCQVCEQYSAAELRQELYDLLSHELTHHIESLAGERGLEIRDEEELEAYFAEWDDR